MSKIILVIYSNVYNVFQIFTINNNKGENVHRFALSALRGEHDIWREQDRERATHNK